MKYQPPAWIDKWLSRLLAPHLREEVMGDLNERYQRRSQRLGETNARQRYWRDALTYVRWSNIKRKPNPYPTTNLYSPTMLRNYLKIAFRTLTRHKLYTALNVAGLTFGITCFLIIGLSLFDELTFDQQHRNASRIYRVLEHIKTKTDDLTVAAVSYKLAEESKKSIPEIETTARMTSFGRDNLSNPETKNKVHLVITFSARPHSTLIAWARSAFAPAFVPLSSKRRLPDRVAAVMIKRNSAVEATLTLPGITRPVGRPRKPDALTGAQRQRAYRARLKASAISVTRDENSLACLSAASA